MSSLGILITCAILGLVTEVSCLFWYIRKDLHWLREVLLPWMNSIHNDIKDSK